jgi:hypothetical protein
VRRAWCGCYTAWDFRFGEIAMQRLPYSLQITNGIAIGICQTIEVKEDRRTIWFRCEQVIQLQTELLCQMTNRRMPLIDKFTAMFCRLSLRKITSSGPTTATEARVRFINCGVDATPLQTISTGQSSQTRSHHDHPCAG